MPKQKTKKSLSKRFKITGTGKVIRGHQASRHKKASKSKRRLRTFREPIILGIRQAKIVKSVIAQ